MRVPRDFRVLAMGQYPGVPDKGEAYLHFDSSIAT
jgi:hypothetical protein